MQPKSVYQFKIEILDIEPPIWRKIELPSTYNFWELHVCIQDAMGWLDCHLHEFRIVPPKKRNAVVIGIPNEDFGDPIVAGWEVSISEYFPKVGKTAMYIYDFGDDWYHQVTLEKILLPEENAIYPRCIDGQRACPPEDCGGIDGYYELLEILSDRNHDEYESMVDWLRNHVKNYHPYDPEFFDPTHVKFDNPHQRMKKNF